MGRRLTRPASHARAAFGDFTSSILLAYDVRRAHARAVWWFQRFDSPQGRRRLEEKSKGSRLHRSKGSSLHQSARPRQADRPMPCRRSQGTRLIRSPRPRRRIARQSSSNRTPQHSTPQSSNRPAKSDAQSSCIDVWRIPLHKPRRASGQKAITCQTHPSAQKASISRLRPLRRCQKISAQSFTLCSTAPAPRLRPSRLT